MFLKGGKPRGLYDVDRGVVMEPMQRKLASYKDSLLPTSSPTVVICRLFDDIHSDMHRYSEEVLHLLLIFFGKMSTQDSAHFD